MDCNGLRYPHFIPNPKLRVQFNSVIKENEMDCTLEVLKIQTKYETCAYTYNYIYTCLYLCMYVCMYVNMYTFMYTCMCLCVCVFVCVCVCGSINFCIYRHMALGKCKPILHYALGLRFGKSCKPQIFQNGRTKCNWLAFSPNA